jgi:hypothetical protein
MRRINETLFAGLIETTPTNPASGFRPNRQKTGFIF